MLITHHLERLNIQKDMKFRYRLVRLDSLPKQGWSTITQSHAKVE